MKKMFILLTIAFSLVSVDVSAASGKKLPTQMSDEYMAMMGPGTRKTYRVSGKCLAEEIKAQDKDGRIGCVSCDPGYYYKGTSCQPCTGNTYMEKRGVPKSCKACPKGRKANKNHTKCVKA